MHMCGPRSMDSHMNLDGEKTKFDFTRLEDHPDCAEPLLDSHIGSSLTKPYWPQSYDRSMGFHSRSPSLQSLFSWHPQQPPEQSCPDPSLNGCKDSRLSGAKVPLINRSFHSEDNEASIECPQTIFPYSATQLHIQHTGHGSHQGSQTTFLQTILNGVNMLAGVGILSMPYAVSQGGWIGVSFLVIFALVCCYTGVLLRRCLDLDPHLHGYPDVGQAAFGRCGRMFVSGLLYGELFCVAVEFLILEGDNLTQLVTWEGIDFGFFKLSSQKSSIILSAAVMLPTVWLRDLSLLSYISAGGVIACVTVLLAVAAVGISGVGFTHPGHLLNIQGFPIAVGLYAFCYCGHAVFPNIYGSMRDKTKFSHVLAVCFVICTLIYGGMAVLGFMMFGDDIESQVTLNLPRGKVATRVAVFATLVTPFAKYALTVTPLAAALEEFLPSRLKAWNFVFCGMIIRTLLVISTVVVALTVPFFAYLMALVGSFLSTTVAISIPCLCYMKLFSGRLPLWEKVMISCFLAIGLLACVAGTYSSVVEIVESLSSS